MGANLKRFVRSYALRQKRSYRQVCRLATFVVGYTQARSSQSPWEVHFPSHQLNGVGIRTHAAVPIQKAAIAASYAVLKKKRNEPEPASERDVTATTQRTARPKCKDGLEGAVYGTRSL
jgi:hypothetical protein